MELTTVRLAVKPVVVSEGPKLTSGSSEITMLIATEAESIVFVGSENDFTDLIYGLRREFKKIQDSRRFEGRNVVQ